MARRVLEPPRHAAAGLDSIQEANVFLLPGNSKPYGQIWSHKCRRGERSYPSTCWLDSCPCSPGGHWPFLSKSTLLTHILFVFYLDSQVFFCKVAFWIGGPEVSLLHGITHSQVQVFALVLIEFHETPTGWHLQLVKIHLLARRKEICHGHLKQLTGEKQLNLMEGWSTENLKHIQKIFPFL